MSWCPKCRAEYREEFNICNECKVNLVDELDQPKITDVAEYDSDVFLISVENTIEAEVMESLLNSNQIPILKKYKGAGGYLQIYMGGSNFGVDLYVPSKLLTKAREVIAASQSFVAVEGQEDAEEDLLEIDNIFKKKRRIRTWIILLIFIFSLLGITIAAVYNIFFWIIK